jgi:hypothetical protein
MNARPSTGYHVTREGVTPAVNQLLTESKQEIAREHEFKPESQETRNMTPKFFGNKVQKKWMSWLYRFFAKTGAT